MRTGKAGGSWAGGAQGGGRSTPSRAGLVTKAKERREFCRRMGWRIERMPKQQLQVIGVDGVVLFERGESYVNGYLDGLMDGLEGTIWKRSFRLWTDC